MRIEHRLSNNHSIIDGQERRSGGGELSEEERGMDCNDLKMDRN